MDQVKIGRFIAQRRKANNMTQMQLAEKLGITDRAVSKWETGKSLPDVAIMPELCGLLNITINDLFNGEVVVMEDYKEKSEKLLIEMAKQKEQADKNLLTLEILIGVLSIIILLGFTFAASFFDMPDWARICLIIAGVIPCLVGLFFALKIEQTAGYYECAECGHRYVPTFSRVLWAPHMGRTRYMKCPKCGKTTWNKKVLRK